MRMDLYKLYCMISTDAERPQI